MTRRDVPQNAAYRVDIRSAIEFAAKQLLGSHVCEFAFDDAGSGLAWAIRGLGDAEIQHFHRAIISNENVLRAHVPMHEIERCAVEVFDFMAIVQTGKRL